VLRSVCSYSLVFTRTPSELSVIFSFVFVLSLLTHHCNCLHFFANILKIRSELSSLSTVNKRPDLYWDLNSDCLNCNYNARLPVIFVSYAIERIIIRKGEILKLEDEAILECRLFSFSVAQEPIRPRPPHLRFLDPTVSDTDLLQDSSERVISPPQKPLPTQHTKKHETSIHALSGIRTRDPSNREAADLRLRPHCHFYRRVD